MCLSLSRSAWLAVQIRQLLAQRRRKPLQQAAPRTDVERGQSRNLHVSRKHLEEIVRLQHGSEEQRLFPARRQAGWSKLHFVERMRIPLVDGFQRKHRVFDAVAEDLHNILLKDEPRSLHASVVLQVILRRCHEVEPPRIASDIEREPID
eukprot:1113560-Rhodomonas_salina.2